MHFHEVISEGYFTHSKERMRFFRSKGMFKDFSKIFLENKIAVAKPVLDNYEEQFSVHEDFGSIGV